MISIIILNWNGKKWLDKCLQSALTQTQTEIEVILVDNNSSDGSVEHVEKKFPDVKIVRNKNNLGFAGGVNSGVAASRGQFILLLNNDAWISPNTARGLLDELRTRRLDIIAAREASYDGLAQDPYISGLDYLGHPVFLPLTSHGQKNFYLTGVCLLFSRNTYLTTGGLDSDFFMYCEEVDWFWRLRLLGKQFNYSDKQIVNHAGAGSTGSGLKESVFRWRNQNTMQMLLKNHTSKVLVVVVPTYLLINVIEMAAFLLALKPRISMTYIEGWIFNIRHLKRTLQKRQRIRALKGYNKIEALGLYIGLGKLHHLRSRMHSGRKMA